MEPAVNRLDEHGSMNQERTKSINEALRVLSEAAENSASEIRDMIRRDYRQLSNVFSEIRPEVRGAINDVVRATNERINMARDQVMSSTRETVRQVDERVHSNPWAFIGASTGVAIMLGYLLARRRDEPRYQ